MFVFNKTWLVNFEKTIVVVAKIFLSNFWVFSNFKVTKSCLDQKTKHFKPLNLTLVFLFFRIYVPSCSYSYFSCLYAWSSCCGPSSSSCVWNRDARRGRRIHSIETTTTTTTPGLRPSRVETSAQGWRSRSVWTCDGRVLRPEEGKEHG